MYVCLILFLNVFAMIFQCVFSKYYSLYIPPCNIESQCMSRWCCFIKYLWWSFTVYSLCIPPCNIESQCMFPWYCTDPSPGQSLRGNVFVSPFLLPKRNINDNLKPFKHYQKYNVPRSRSIVRWLSSLTVSVRLSVITFSFFEYSIIWWSRPCKPYIFWQLIVLATSTALFWPSSTEYQSVPPSTDPVFNDLMV